MISALRPVGPGTSFFHDLWYHGRQFDGQINKIIAAGSSENNIFIAFLFAVGVAQLVRAQDCGSWGRGFNSRRPPFYFALSLSAALRSNGEREVEAASKLCGESRHSEEEPLI